MKGLGTVIPSGGCIPIVGIGGTCDSPGNDAISSAGNGGLGKYNLASYNFFSFADFFE